MVGLLLSYLIRRMIHFSLPAAARRYEYTQVECNTRTQITVVIGNGNRSYHNKYAIGTAKPPTKYAMETLSQPSST